jgi:hypothetical protein
LIRFTSVKLCQYGSVGAARVVPALVIATRHFASPELPSGPLIQTDARPGLFPQADAPDQGDSLIQLGLMAARQEPKVCRLTAGGRRIRTIGPSCKKRVVLVETQRLLKGADERDPSKLQPFSARNWKFESISLLRRVCELSVPTSPLKPAPAALDVAEPAGLRPFLLSGR